MTFSKFKSDMCWLYTLLAMIGEQFDHGDDLHGAVAFCCRGSWTGFVNLGHRKDSV
ncbi:putative translation Initiation factor eIF-4e [Helianthus anomalus]